MESLFKGKKGSGVIQTLAISILIIGFVLGIGFLLLGEFSDTLGDETTTVAHEEVTLADLTAGVYVLNNDSTAGIYCYNSFSPTVYNITDGTIAITSGNYSYEHATGKMWNTTVDTYLGAAFDNVVNVSYTYRSSTSEACAGLDETVRAAEEIPEWLTIIVILVIVGLLLVIALKITTGGSAENAQGSIKFGRFKGGGSFGSGGNDGTIAQI